MKKTAVVLALSFISVFSIAQVERVVKPKSDSTNKPVVGMNEKNSSPNRKQMLRELNLTKEQRAKLKEMRQANEAKKDAINNNESLSQEQKDAQLRELKRASVQSTMTILNDEQKVKMKAMRTGKGKKE